MARGKSLNVKITTVKVIAALEAKLAEIQNNKDNQKANEEKHSKAMEKYHKDVAKLALANISKATDLTAHTRYNGEVNVQFSLPKGTIDIVEPKKDFETFHEWQYKEMIEEVENAIRVLKMTDDEFVSASTFGSISKYL